MAAPSAPFTPALMKSREAAWYLGVSESKLRELDLPRRELGGLRLYDRADLDRFVASLPYEGEQREAAACQAADEAFGRRASA